MMGGDLLLSCITRQHLKAEIEPRCVLRPLKSAEEAVNWWLRIAIKPLRLDQKVDGQVGGLA